MGTVKLAAYVPPDAFGLPLIDLITRAEGKLLELVTAKLRRDDLTSALMGTAEEFDRALSAWLSSRSITKTLEDIGERTRAASDSHWAAELTRAASRPISWDTSISRQTLQGWIAQNTARIQTLRSHTITRIREDLETAILSGTRAEELAAQWEREGLPTLHGRLRGRANIIARDQLLTLAGQLARAQQEALGLVEYQWDDRPSLPRQHRLVHRGRRGARYRWDGPPPGGHPGEAIMCRCRAVAVVSLDRLAQIEGDPFELPGATPR